MMSSDVFSDLLDAMGDANDLVKWLNDRLSERNWSQNELARRAKVGSGAISRTLNGEAPGLKVSRAIARALGVPDETILTLAGHIKSPPDYDPDVEELTHLFEQLSERDQQELLRIAQMKLDSRGKGDKQKR